MDGRATPPAPAILGHELHEVLDAGANPLVADGKVKRRQRGWRVGPAWAVSVRHRQEVRQAVQCAARTRLNNTVPPPEMHTIRHEARRFAHSG